MLQNARVLQPEFVPREIQHRDSEHTALTAIQGLGENTAEAVLSKVRS